MPNKPLGIRGPYNFKTSIIPSQIVLVSSRAMNRLCERMLLPGQLCQFTLATKTVAICTGDLRHRIEIYAQEKLDMLLTEMNHKQMFQCII